MNDPDSTGRIDSREHFLSFAETMLGDARSGAVKFENATTDRFLEALVAYTRDADVEAEPSWRTFAQLLRAGAMYE